jgi:hypothetical protein
MTKIQDIAKELLFESMADMASADIRSRLKVIGTPALLKIAQQLFQFANAETDDHSSYPNFLYELDALLRKHGARSAMPEGPETNEAELEPPRDPDDD